MRKDQQTNMNETWLSSLTYFNLVTKFEEYIVLQVDALACRIYYVVIVLVFAHGTLLEGEGGKVEVLKETLRNVGAQDL